MYNVILLASGGFHEKALPDSLDFRFTSGGSSAGPVPCELSHAGPVDAPSTAGSRHPARLCVASGSPVLHDVLISLIGTATGYFGLFAGPPSIGFLADAAGLRTALGVVVVLVLSGGLFARYAVVESRAVMQAEESAPR